MTTIFLGASLLLPAAASAGTDEVVVSSECVIEPTATNSGSAALDQAVLGLSTAQGGAAAAVEELATHGTENTDLSEIEALVVVDAVDYSEEATAEVEDVLKLIELATTGTGDLTVDTQPLEAVDQLILNVDERVAVLSAEADVNELAGLPTEPLSMVVSNLAEVRVATEGVQAALKAELTPESRDAYEAPTASTTRTLKLVRSEASAEMAAVAVTDTAEIATLIANIAELASAEAAVSADVVDRDLLVATRGAMESVVSDLGTAQASFDAAASAITEGQVASAEPLAQIDSIAPVLTAAIERTAAVAAELAVTHEGQSVELTQARTAARSAIVAMNSVLVAQQAKLAEARLAVTKAMPRKALSSYVRPTPDLALFESVHADNAAAFTTAIASLDELQSASGEAESLRALAVQASRFADLEANIAEAAAAAEDLAAAQARAIEIATAERSTVLDAARFADPSEALTEAALAMAVAEQRMLKAKANLEKLVFTRAAGVTRDQAVAAITRLTSKVDAALQSIRATDSVRAKYTIAGAATKKVATKEATVVKKVAPVATKEATVVKEAAPVAAKEAAVTSEASAKSESEIVTVTNRKAPAAKTEAKVTQPAVKTVVRGAIASQNVITVTEGQSVTVMVAEGSEEQVVVSIDDITTHGTFVLTLIDGACQLTFTSVTGCVGVESVDVTVEVAGVQEVRTLDFDVVAAQTTDTTTTTTTTAAPAAAPVLALTGPSSTQTMLVTAFILIVVGGSLRRVATVEIDQR